MCMWYNWIEEWVINICSVGIGWNIILIFSTIQLLEFLSKIFWVKIL